MQVSEMIAQLQRFQAEVGDAEVLVSDGRYSVYYRGNYYIGLWQDNGKWCIDIGIGDCRE